MRRFALCFITFVVACSSSREAPVQRDTFAQIAKFPEFAVHLAAPGALTSTPDGARLATATGFRLLAELDVTVSSARTRIARVDDPDAWIELAAVTTSGTPELRGAALLFRDAARDTDVVHVLERARYEELRVLRTAEAPTSTRYRVVRGPSIAALRIVSGQVQALAHDGRVRIESAPAFALDDHGARRDLTARLDGEVLELTLDPTGLAYPIVVDPLWTATPDLMQPRCNHGAAPLPDGRAMIAGGLRSFGSSLNVFTTLAFDPTAKTWASLANLPSSGDSFATTVLPSGKIVVTGGNFGGLPGRNAYVYDPATNTWDAGGNHGSPYRATVMAPLSGDRGLAVGWQEALLWSYAAKTFTIAGTATVAHSGHTATTLAGDRVLLVGGTTTVADLWDPATSTFSNGGTLTALRSAHTATLLSTGKVLIAGGSGESTAELYDPATKTFASAGAMAGVRTLHTASLLPGDRVLMIGGQDGAGATLSTTEIYDAKSNTWTTAAPMSIPRVHHTATVMPGPRVLVVGGANGMTALSTAEVFAPYDKGAACATSSDCSSGFCVDGACCDTACNGQCEACDVAGSVGTCSPVSGSPRGSRMACAAEGTGVCARACDGVDRAKCNFASSSVVCAAATCAAGSATSEVRCDGAGACPASTTTDCAPYACGGTTCKTTCTADADCGGANVCDRDSGKCIAAIASTCSADGSSEVASGTQVTTACAPFLCDSTTGRCATRCTSSANCVTGTVCDVKVGKCNELAAPAGEGDDGGCGVAHRPPPANWLVVALAALAAATRRTRSDGATR